MMSNDATQKELKGYCCQTLVKRGKRDATQKELKAEYARKKRFEAVVWDATQKELKG